MYTCYNILYTCEHKHIDNTGGAHSSESLPLWAESLMVVIYKLYQILTRLPQVMPPLDIPAFAEKSPTSPEIEGKAVTLRISETEITMIQRSNEVRSVTGHDSVVCLAVYLMCPPLTYLCLSM